MNPMRCLKWMLPLWLLCQAGLAMADWEAVDENHLAVVYIDPNKIRASSVYPQAWHLFDLFDKTKAGVKSRLVLMEYDCHDSRRRTLAFASKSDAMGEGKTMFTSVQATPWKPVAGETVGEKVIVMLCGQRSQAKTHQKGSGAGKPAAKDDGHGGGDAHAAPAPAAPAGH
jgi:hypothetical protein